MNRISSAFNRPGHTALIAYVTAGYPSVEATLNVVPLLASNGCDIVELGIPFSDPLADGATVQKASFQALQNGVTLKLCFDTAKKLSQRVDTPLVFMTYFNPVLRYGMEEFCGACADSGVSGLIIPDLTPEEGSELGSIAEKHNIDLIYLLAPSSTEDRIRLVAEKSKGFIYLVSVTGTTGARNELPEHLESFVSRVRETTAQPLCVGFGISTPEQAGRVARSADGIIVGSRLVQLMESDASLASVAQLTRGLRQALDNSAK